MHRNRVTDCHPRGRRRRHQRFVRTSPCRRWPRSRGPAVYDRANLGNSDPAPGPRGLPELVADLEQVISAAKIPGPYVLVGTSGGGYITAGYAFAHPRSGHRHGLRRRAAPRSGTRRHQSFVTLAGTRRSTSRQRDYLQVEKDAWSARKRVGDIPVTVISNRYSAEEIAGAEFASERRGMRSNVKDQRGWLIISPQAKQMVVHTGQSTRRTAPPWRSSRSTMPRSSTWRWRCSCWSTSAIRRPSPRPASGRCAPVGGARSRSPIRGPRRTTPAPTGDLGLDGRRPASELADVIESLMTRTPCLPRLG